VFVNKWLIYWSLAFVYGSVHLFIGIAVDQLAAFELVFSRMLVAGVLLNGYLLLRGKRYPTDRRALALIALLGFVNIALPVSMVAWAQQFVTSGLTSVLSAMTPLFALVFAHFAFTDERMTPLKVSGILIGFMGVVILTSRNIDPTHILSDDLLAELVIIASTTCFALSNVISRKVISRGVEPLVMSSGVISFAMLYMGIMTYAIAPNLLRITPLPLADWLPQIAMAVLVLVLVHTILSYTLSFFVIREFGVVRTTALLYLSPPISLALGIAFRGEAVDLMMLVGTVVILAGVMISNGAALRALFNRRFSPHVTPVRPVSESPAPALVQPPHVRIPAQRSARAARRIAAQFRLLR
jgi:drug/metabolite transporter (DMT)-like permease